MSLPSRGSCSYGGTLLSPGSFKAIPSTLMHSEIIHVYYATKESNSKPWSNTLLQWASTIVSALYACHRMSRWARSSSVGMWIASTVLWVSGDLKCQCDCFWYLLILVALCPNSDDMNIWELQPTYAPILVLLAKVGCKSATAQQHWLECHDPSDDVIYCVYLRIVTIDIKWLSI